MRQKVLNSSYHRKTRRVKLNLLNLFLNFEIILNSVSNIFVMLKSLKMNNILQYVQLKNYMYIV